MAVWQVPGEVFVHRSYCLLGLGDVEEVLGRVLTLLGESNLPDCSSF